MDVTSPFRVKRYESIVLSFIAAYKSRFPFNVNFDVFIFEPSIATNIILYLKNWLQHILIIPRRICLIFFKVVGLITYHTVIHITGSESLR